MATGEADSTARSILGVARVGGALALAFGVVVLLGWASGLEALVRISPSLPSMVPNTAVMFVCCGVVVLIETFAGARPGARSLRFALLGLMLAIAAVTLFEYLVDTSASGELLFSADETTDARGMLPAPQTAIAFFLLGIALASARSGAAGQRSSARRRSYSR